METSHTHETQPMTFSEKGKRILRTSLQKLADAYGPESVTQEHMKAYVRICSALEPGTKKDALLKAEHIIKGVSRAAGISATVLDATLTGFAGLYAFDRWRSLSARRSHIENVPFMASVAQSETAPTARKLTRKALLSIAGAGAVFAVTPFHHVMKFEAKAVGFIGEKVARIMNDIATGKAQEKTRRVLRIGTGKPLS